MAAGQWGVADAAIAMDAPASGGPTGTSGFPPPSSSGGPTDTSGFPPPSCGLDAPRRLPTDWAERRRPDGSVILERRSHRCAAVAVVVLAAVMLLGTIAAVALPLALDSPRWVLVFAVIPAAGLLCALLLVPYAVDSEYDPAAAAFATCVRRLVPVASSRREVPLAALTQLPAFAAGVGKHGLRVETLLVHAGGDGGSQVTALEHLPPRVPFEGEVAAWRDFVAGLRRDAGLPPLDDDPAALPMGAERAGRAVRAVQPWPPASVAVVGAMALCFVVGAVVLATLGGLGKLDSWIRVLHVLPFLVIGVVFAAIAVERSVVVDEARGVVSVSQRRMIAPCAPCGAAGAVRQLEPALEELRALGQPQPVASVVARRRDGGAPLVLRTGLLLRPTAALELERWRRVLSAAAGESRNCPSTTGTGEHVQ